MAQNAKKSFSLNQKEIWFIVHKLYYRYELPATAIKLYFFLLHQHNRTQYVGDFRKPLISYRAEGARYTDTQPLSISLISEKLKMPRRDVRKNLDYLIKLGLVRAEISRTKTIIFLDGVFQTQQMIEPTQPKPNKTITAVLMDLARNSAAPPF
jgi:hypothetical protein